LELRVNQHALAVRVPQVAASFERFVFEINSRILAVGEQIEWLRKYASILETRHRERLSISSDVAEDARHIVVPRFLLQPLLENAVNHGALCVGRKVVKFRCVPQ
jgi:sensor histidine kinase YesM